MAKTSTLQERNSLLLTLTGTVVAAIVVAALYWAQAVLIPVALAIFLTFLLSPLVSLLQRARLNRIVAVVLTVTMAVLLLSGVGFIVIRQVNHLLAELPRHTDNIRAKVKSLRELTEGGALQNVEAVTKEINKELQLDKKTDQPGNDPFAIEQPQTVVVRPETPGWLGRLPQTLAVVIEPAASGALVMVLVLFMLLNREDLRNRLIRLIGHGHITATTQAVDEAAHRISRYLLMQLIINGTYGLAMAAGLYLFGVDYALLWGLLAGLLRYVPYVGPFISAVMPVGLSLAQSVGWTQPLLVLGLILVLELVSNSFMEPWLYGQSMGVSETALLIAAAFWTFLWGPIGLVLSGPLTVVLVVLGRHVPQLEFIDVLLGDEPALSEEASYYQRLLAHDQDEASDIVQQYAETHSVEAVFDELLIPALCMAKRDRERGILSEESERFVRETTREFVDDLGETLAQERAAQVRTDRQPWEQEFADSGNRVRILAHPAHDELDQLALQMLRQLADPTRWDIEIATTEMLSGELLSKAEDGPDAILVGSLPPGGLAHTRYLCKRLRSRFADLHIMAGRWGLRAPIERETERLRAAGADEIATTLRETHRQLNAWFPALSAKAEQPTTGTPIA